MLSRIISKHRNQKGSTLVELLVGLTITAIIGSVIVTTLTQLISVSAADKNRMEAVKQVENALHYINRDVQMASAADITPSNSTLTLFTSGLTLRWTDYTTTPWVGNTVEYNLDVNGNLQRTITVGTDAPVTTRIATHIVVAESHYSFDSAILTVSLSAEVEGYKSAKESRTLQVKPRIN